MVRDIRNLEESMGVEDIFISEGAQSAMKKLERSIASIGNIEAGTMITENNIHLLSPGDGYKWTEKDKVIGKRAKRKILKDEIIYPHDIE
jgi:sialic acid synthase